DARGVEHDAPGTPDRPRLGGSTSGAARCVQRLLAFLPPCRTSHPGAASPASPAFKVSRSGFEQLECHRGRGEGTRGAIGRATMITHFRLGFSLVILLGLFSGRSLSAYQERTHEQLSNLAFTMSGIAQTLENAYGIAPDAVFRQRGIGLPGGLRKAEDWVTLGGSYEDVPFWRVLNHFYDPLHNEGLGWLGGVAAPDWGLEPAGELDGQNHSYRDARNAFYRGLTASSPTTRERELGFTFFALGHVI